MPTIIFPRCVTVIAIIIIILVAYYAGKISVRPVELSSPAGVSTSTLETATDTAPMQTAKVPTPSSPTYTPVLTRIAVRTRGNTTILKCTGVVLNAAGFDQKGALFPLRPTWSTSDTAIATVNAIGDVVSSGVGRVNITAREGVVSGSITITVIVSAGRGNTSPCPGVRR